MSESRGLSCPSSLIKNRERIDLNFLQWSEHHPTRNLSGLVDYGCATTYTITQFDMHLFEVPFRFDAMLKGTERLELFSKESFHARRSSSTDTCGKGTQQPPLETCGEQILIRRMLDVTLVIQSDHDRYDNTLAEVVSPNNTKRSIKYNRIYNTSRFGSLPIYGLMLT
jgi:hypothetical protein